LHSKTKYTILLISSVVVVYAIVGGMMGRASAQNGSYQKLSIFMEVINRIQNDYVDDPSLTDAFAGAIRGMVERVDPHGCYLSPESVRFYEDFDPRTGAGIGVTLAKKFDYPMIVSAVPGGPASRAGFGTGDTIEAIGGESLREHNLVEVRQLLAGSAGSEVELAIIRRRRPAPEIVTLTRAVVEPPAVETRLLDQEVGYLKVPVLAPGKALEAKRKLESLTEQGAAHIVLDLRNTAGGTPQEAFELANLFVESGTLGYLDGQTVERETFTAKAGNAISELPLVVLINQGTADAAEMAAAAIAENGRGQLVGLRTFGMGTVQRLLPLDDGWALLLSVANYYTPSGREIQKEGIEPTIEVAEAADLDPLASPTETSSETDRQLDRAIEILLSPAEAANKAA
jgi:carboxyl-terminal processing protease